MRRGVLKSVGDNFLGTYSSRYSSWQGYWLWGFIVAEHLRIEWDLLDPPADARARPLDYAQVLGVRKFHEQCAKRRLIGRVTRAELLITTSTFRETINIQTMGRPACDMRFTLRTAAGGTAASSERIILVAAHDPRKERQSAD